MKGLRTKPYVGKFPTYEEMQTATLEHQVDMIAGRVLFIIDNEEAFRSQDSLKPILADIIRMNRELITKISPENPEVSQKIRRLPFKTSKPTILGSTQERDEKGLVGKEINILHNEITALIMTQARTLVAFPETTLKQIYEVIDPLFSPLLFSNDRKDIIKTLVASFFKEARYTEKQYDIFDGAEDEEAIKILRDNFPQIHLSRLDVHHEDNTSTPYVFEWTVTLRVYRGSLLFFFENENDYKKIAWEYYSPEALTAGMYFPMTDVENLDFWNLIIVNGGEDYEETILHEVAHRKNAFVKHFVRSSDFDGLKDIFKTMHDEIISFMEEHIGNGNGDMNEEVRKQHKTDLKNILLGKWSRYIKIPHRRKKTQKPHRQVKEYYVKHGDAFIEEAFRIKLRYPNLYLPLLAATPIEMWKYLIKEN